MKRLAIDHPDAETAVIRVVCDPHAEQVPSMLPEGSTFALREIVGDCRPCDLCA